MSADVIPLHRPGDTPATRCPECATAVYWFVDDNLNGYWAVCEACGIRWLFSAWQRSVTEWEEAERRDHEFEDVRRYLDQCAEIANPEGA